MTESQLNSLAEQIVERGQHVLLVGPPGTGKTLLARRIAVQIAKRRKDRQTQAEIEMIWAMASMDVSRHGIRAPHHTISLDGMRGLLRRLSPRGESYKLWPEGRKLAPGEISLAHGGVLFLDETDEFSLPVLEAVRDSARHGEVRLYGASLPAKVFLVGAVTEHPVSRLNPDPRHGDRLPKQIERALKAFPVSPAIIQMPAGRL